MLMRLAPQGGRPTEIAEALGLKQNTLSHYLGELESCGLIGSERQGRSLFYSVDLTRTAGLVDYLVNDCCRGRADFKCPTPEQGIAPEVTQPPYNVLFICSGNSARSVFAEAILNRIGGDKFRAFSAGTRPGSQLNPFAVAILQRNGLETEGLRAKHISEFDVTDAPRMNFIFTVCDAAAAEECAPWPGQPLTAHWGVPDPVKATGTEAEKGLAFAKAFSELNRRIMAFSALSIEQLDRIALQRSIDNIGLDKA
jgi:ArsR family transcriptional regulator, arsenate/arsenite/antimonite-responsive transcriptional repressor / arsenate reductase (thioredoxin)